MKKLLALIALACPVFVQAQTNLIPFIVNISPESMYAITNAWRTHQAAVILSPITYGGRVVTPTLVVTNEATGEGYTTNVVTWSNPRVTVADFRRMVAGQARVEQQLIEIAGRIEANAAKFIVPPIVATNTP